MSVVKRRRDAIDALEHAMQGVQTHDPERLERRYWGPVPIEKRSGARSGIADDTPVEHEVTVKVHPIPRRRRAR
jgi:hypothetical protein